MTRNGYALLTPIIAGIFGGLFIVIATLTVERGLYGALPRRAAAPARTAKGAGMSAAGKHEASGEKE